LKVRHAIGRLVVRDMARWLARNLFIIWVTISFLSSVPYGDDSDDVDGGGGGVIESLRWKQIRRSS
jgi:hypothetical protein